MTAAAGPGRIPGRCPGRPRPPRGPPRSLPAFHPLSPRSRPTQERRRPGSAARLASAEVAAAPAAFSSPDRLLRTPGKVPRRARAVPSPVSPWRPGRLRPLPNRPFFSDGLCDSLSPGIRAPAALSSPEGPLRAPKNLARRAQLSTRPSRSRRWGPGARCSLLPGRASPLSEESPAAGPGNPLARFASAGLAAGTGPGQRIRGSSLASLRPAVGVTEPAAFSSPERLLRAPGKVPR